MQTRRDLLQAHRLMTQRAALALLQAEPDPPDQPLRRLNVGLISSVLVAVIVAAAFGVWGLLAPGDAQGLTSAGTLIIDSQTGTSYIWCDHHKLCPVVNYASARLALSSSAPDQRTVSQASLARYPRGPLIGIPGLPEPLPDAHMLVGQPWSVCVQTVTDPATLQRQTTTTLVGGRRVGGRPIAAASALLVASAGRDWVLWDGQRLMIPRGIQQNVLTALAAAGSPGGCPCHLAERVPAGLRLRTAADPGVRPPGAWPRGRDGPYRAGIHHHVGGRRIAAVLRLAPRRAGTGHADPGGPAERRARPGSAGGGGSFGRGRRPGAGRHDTRRPAAADAVAGQLRPGGPALRGVLRGRLDPGSGGRLTVGGTVPGGGLPVGSPGSHTQIALPPGKATLAGMVPGPAGASAGRHPGGDGLLPYLRGPQVRARVPGGSGHARLSPGRAAHPGARERP